MSAPTKQDAIRLLDVFDPEMSDLLHREERRQFETIGLIASENVVSPLASALEGSVFTNKNTEGHPGKRYVGGCELAEAAELLAIERVKKVFGAEHANIQSGNATIANMAVLTGLLKPGDTFMGLTLDNGGHLSHGAKFHYSGRQFNALQTHERTFYRHIVIRLERQGSRIRITVHVFALDKADGNLR